MSSIEEKDPEESVVSVLEHFSDFEAVYEIICSADAYYADAYTCERKQEQLKSLLNKYVEQPHLLDLYLGKIFHSIIAVLKSPDSPMGLKEYLCRCSFCFINVRGYKAIVRFLPHEIKDLNIALNLLENEEKCVCWEMPYFLLLWLSIIVMLPFDMARLETTCDKSKVQKSLPVRIMEICKKYLFSRYKTQHAAAFLCAMFVSRADIKQLYLKELIDWICIQITVENPKINVWSKAGFMTALAFVLKHSRREDVLPYVSNVYDCLLNSNFLNDEYRLKRKLAIKIAQRIGLVCLRVRVASWRYNRGSRSLALSLKPNENTVTSAIVENESNDSMEPEDNDIPPLVEQIVAHLLGSLKDDDITVRWSAAKGIGRITDRLTPEFGDQIVDHILTLFSPVEDCSAWNGGCLALAELGRRGLLMPKRLPKVVEVLMKALIFEAPLKGSMSTSYVRDAACYTVWSLARAYDPVVLKPYVPDIAASLVIVMAFDRESSCRRAASATFQEHVGRQGAFPHGIEIITEADYFAVGRRRHAFLNVSVFIAQFPEYTKKMIDHLIQHKINHWEAEVRELTSMALYKLAPIDPDYTLSKLKEILHLTESTDINTKHGALLSIGEIVRSFSDLGQGFILSKGIVQHIENVVPKYNAGGYLQGVGGDLLRQACCFLIMECSLGKLPISGNTIDCWEELLNESMTHQSNKISTAACSSLSTFLNQYFTEGDKPKPEFLKKLQSYARGAVSGSENSRRTYISLLGLLPTVFIKNNLDLVVDCLVKCLEITEYSRFLVYVRKESVDSLVSIWKRLCIDFKDNATLGLGLSYTVHFLNLFTECLSDYTTDKRGEMGSFVRQSAIKGIEVLLTSDSNIVKNVVTGDIVEKCLALLGKQAVEKLRTVRVVACNAFVKVLFSDLPEFPNREKIRHIFEGREFDKEEDVFPIFVQLLQFQTFQFPVTTGFIKSIGGITQSVVKCAFSCFAEFLEQSATSVLITCCQHILAEFRSNSRNELVTKPMLNFLLKFLTLPSLRVVLEDPENSFAEEIYTLTKQEVTGTTDVSRLKMSVEIFCLLIQATGDTSKKALSTVCSYLCHRSAWLRKLAALKFMEAIMMYSDKCGISAEDEEEIIDLLTNYDWVSLEINEILERRDKICQILNIHTPKVTSPKNK